MSEAVTIKEEPRRMPEWKRLWQQRNRAAFKAANGYSSNTHYRFQGRKDLLPRLNQRKRLISAERMAELRSQGKTFREIGVAAGMDGSLCRKLIIKMKGEKNAER